MPVGQTWTLVTIDVLTAAAACLCSFPGRRGVERRVRVNKPRTCLASESVVCDGMASKARVKGASFLVRPEIKCSVHAGVGRWGTAFWQPEKMSKFLLVRRGRYKKIDRVPGLIPCLPRGMLAALEPWLRWGF